MKKNEKLLPKNSESDLPDPLTPPDCDLRGNDWMPLHGERLFKSRFYALARRDARAGLAGIKLWWEAWVQKPAASLPNDDFELADLAGFGENLKAWRAAKDIALHGFKLCSDGRYYHVMLSEQAIVAYAIRLKSDKKRGKDAERLRLWREAHKGKTPAQSDDAEASTKQNEMRVETRSETRDATRAKRVSTTTQQGAKNEEKSPPEVKKEIIQRPKKREKRGLLSSDPIENNDLKNLKRVSSLRDSTRQDSTKKSLALSSDPLAASEPEKTISPMFGKDAPRIGDPPERWQTIATDFGTIDGVRMPCRNGYVLPIVAPLLLEAARMDPANYRDWRAMCAWLDDDILPDDIIAAIRDVASRPNYKPPGSLSYFDQPVRAWKGRAP